MCTIAGAKVQQNYNCYNVYSIECILFSYMKSEKELEEMKQVLSDYYFQKVEKRAAELYKNKGWTQETLDAMANEHFRVPYK